MGNSTRRTPFRRFLGYIRPVRGYFFGAVVCGVFKFTMPVATAWLLGKIVTALTDTVLTGPERLQLVFRYALLGGGLLAVSPFFVYYRHMLGARATLGVINNLRFDLFSHVQRLSHSFFNRNRSGSLASRIISDVAMIQMFLNQVFIQMWMHLAVIIWILSYFFYQNWFLALLSLSLLPLQIIVLKTLGRKTKENAKRIQAQLAVLSGNTIESLSNISVVKTFTAEKGEEQRFTTSNESLMELGMANSRLGSFNQVLNTLIGTAAPLIVATVGGYIALTRPDALSLGVLVTFVLMQGQIFGPITQLADMQLTIAGAQGAIDRIYELFDTAPEVADRPGAVRAANVTGRIQFNDVRFSYASGGDQVLNGVDLEIKPYQTVAFVGSSGSGKSTAANLIPRFYDVDSGSITLDGVPLTGYRLRSLRKRIGIVPQEPMLFSGSIFDNILYGNPNMEPAKVFEAAQLAYADDFIRHLPRKYETRVGERGAQLSGGQRQRIAIARAFLKDPPILILDEATSALDNESEAVVQKALNTLMKNRTTILIAHRLSTVVNADMIFVFDAGRVIERGCHDELLALNGKYAALAALDGTHG